MTTYLRAVGARTGVGHGQQAFLGVLQLEIFISELCCRKIQSEEKKDLLDMSNNCSLARRRLSLPWLRTCRDLSFSGEGKTTFFLGFLLRGRSLLTVTISAQNGSSQNPKKGRSEQEPPSKCSWQTLTHGNLSNSLKATFSSRKQPRRSKNLSFRLRRGKNKSTLVMIALFS